MSAITERRYGKFCVAMEVFEDDGAQERLKKLFSDMIILKAETLFVSHHIEYIAASDKFKVSPAGTEVPYYSLFFNSDTQEWSIS